MAAASLGEANAGRQQQGKEYDMQSPHAHLPGF